MKPVWFKNPPKNRELGAKKAVARDTLPPPPETIVLEGELPEVCPEGGIPIAELGIVAEPSPEPVLSGSFVVTANLTVETPVVAVVNHDTEKSAEEVSSDFALVSEEVAAPKKGKKKRKPVVEETSSTTEASNAVQE